jgi:hypothetical protein
VEVGGKEVAVGKGVAAVALAAVPVEVVFAVELHATTASERQRRTVSNATAIPRWRYTDMRHLLDRGNDRVGWRDRAVGWKIRVGNLIHCTSRSKRP